MPKKREKKITNNVKIDDITRFNQTRALNVENKQKQNKTILNRYRNLDNIHQISRCLLLFYCSGSYDLVPRPTLGTHGCSKLLRS